MDRVQFTEREYFSLLKQHLEARNEKFEYSLFKIKPTIGEVKELISAEQICEVYWERMVNTIHSMQKTGITDNTMEFYN